MPPPSPPTPKALKGGRYTVIRPLGEGAQGETYEARDHGIFRDHRDPSRLVENWNMYVERARAGETPDSHGLVAIKSFRVGKAKAWKEVELAEREARTLASLDHPRLPKYIEHFEEDGALYLVMEKVEGESLAKLRSRGRTFSVAEITKMLEDMADALRYLHGRAPPIVHRDIKPGNVIRRPDGSYALVDFGAVRDHLKPGGGSTVVGTFGYMAPEQFQGRASSKSDLYGLGATALAMLTGSEPEDLPHAGLGIDVPRAVPPATPEGLRRALTAMLMPDPDRRVDTVDEALALLRASKESKRAEQPTHRREARPTRKERREREKRERHEKREAKRERRAAARKLALPFVPRTIIQSALFVAVLSVWVVVGVLTPVVLTMLSLVFGASLRRAATASISAAQRAQAAIGRASSWAAGHRDEPARVRIAHEAESATRVAHAAEPNVGLHERVSANDLARDEARGELDDDMKPAARRR